MSNRLSQETKELLLNGTNEPRDLYVAAEDFRNCGYTKEQTEDLMIEALYMNPALQVEDVLDAINAAYEGEE